MNLNKTKSRRTVIFGIITAAVMIILIVANFLMTYFGLYENAYIDLTPEELYTVSDAMKKEISFIDDELGKKDGDKTVKVTFCTDPDYLTSGFSTRPTYFMALSLANIFSNFEVETVNVKNNPTALAKYRPTSLSAIKSTDIVVSYGDRYRIVGAENFWTSDYFSYNGEYKLATLIKSVTTVGQPKAYFVTDHGETYYDVKNPESETSKKTAYLYDLLRDRGLATDTIELGKLEDGIPEDCVLLIINNPTKDFTTDSDRYDEITYISETELLDMYLTKRQGAIMVTKDYSVTLPVLEDFLHEWGFDFSTSQVRDPEASIADEGNTQSTIISVYETEENSYANAIYGEFAGLTSAPSTIFSNTGYIVNSFEKGYNEEPGSPDTIKRYESFLKSSESAVAYAKNEDGSYLDSTVIENNKGSFDLAGVTVRAEFDSVKNEYAHSYLFCSSSAEFFSNSLLGNSSYANFEIVSALIENISRLDVYASMELGGTSLNSTSFGGKQMVDMNLYDVSTNIYSPDAQHIVKVNHAITDGAKIGYTIAFSVVPIAILAVGIVVCIKRRFL